MDFEDFFETGYTTFSFLFSIGFRVVLGIICKKIVEGKGYYGSQNKGFLWGFFLGWIGLIVCACKKNLNQMPMNNMYNQNNMYGANGYNPNGYNNGYDPNRYNNPNGYDPNGYNQNGYNPNSYDPNGYNPNDLTANNSNAYAQGAMGQNPYGQDPYAQNAYGDTYGQNNAAKQEDFIDLTPQNGDQNNYYNDRNY